MEVSQIFEKRLKALLKDSRAMSPLIGTILLIAIIIFAGAIVFVTLMATLAVREPISIEVYNLTSFETTDEGGTLDVNIDKFQFQLQNTGTVRVIVDITKIDVRDGNQTTISGWVISAVTEELFIDGGETILLTINCILDDKQLSPGDLVQVVVNTVRQEDQEPAEVDNAFRSDITLVEDTYGPVVAEIAEKPVPTITNPGPYKMNITLTNYGTDDINLRTEISYYNQSAFIIINNTGTFTIEGVTTSTPEPVVNTVMITFNTTVGIVSGSYLFYIKISDGNRLFALMAVSFTL